VTYPDAVSNGMLLRTVNPFVNLWALAGELALQGDCDNPALVVSPNSAMASYMDTGGDSVGFGWSCFKGSATNYKYIAGQADFVEQECNTKRTYVVSVSLASTYVTFTDDLCGTLSLAETIGGATAASGLYVYIGGNFLHEGGDATWNELSIMHGSSPCSSCAAGTHSAALGRSTACSDQCAAGSFSASGAATCSPCAAGKYTDTTGESSCTTCPAGLSSNSGSVVCESCVTVTVTMSDSYGDGWNGNELYLGGSIFTLATGTTGTDTKCLEPGTYYPYACGGSFMSEVSWTLSFASTTVSGSANSACSSAVTLVVSTCGAGTYISGTNCVDCAVGSYSAAATSSCGLCPAGTFVTTTGATACTDCSPGSYSATTGRTAACDNCAAGTYSTAAFVR
jgi:hypothetical protein